MTGAANSSGDRRPDRAERIDMPARERLARAAGKLLGARGWPRPLLVRRALAAALALLALGLAVAPASSGTPSTVATVVAAKDLTAGVTLTATDVSLRSLPPPAVPTHAVHDVAAVLGRTLASAARAGEPITDVRMVGRQNTVLTSGEQNAVAVAVRLADPGVAALLRPGSRVDVIAVDDADGTGAPGHAARVLARDSAVILVKRSARRGKRDAALVVLALPRSIAPRVASAAVRSGVTVALR